jgi:hypothetical protein
MNENTKTTLDGLNNASYRQLTNIELKNEIIRAEKMIDNSPVQLNNPLILQLLIGAMKAFRKVNAEPIKGEDKKEHKTLLKKYDELIERYNAYFIKQKMNNETPDLSALFGNK